MSDFFFHEGAVPSGYELDFDVSLFSAEEHRKLQSSDGWVSFYLLNSQRKQAKAAVHFFVADGVARSPLRAPYGSIEFSPSLRVQDIYEFIGNSEKALKEKNVLSIEIKNYPEAYQSSHAAILHTLFFNMNYKVVSAEMGSFIRIKDKAAVSDFNDSTKSVFQKGKRAGLSFKQMHKGDFETIYHFIKGCQEGRGYQVSMDFGHLGKSIEAFPRHYLFFAVYHEKQLVAASICVKVSKDTLYDYVHSHDSGFDKLSPVVTLVAGIVDFCKEHQTKILDIGTSAIDGQPDFDLLYFKRSLGSETTMKLTFKKEL